MREVAFIQQNKEKWLRFEETFFERKIADPEQLASLYTELTNDLAYAQTFYPQSKVLTYLNELSTRAYLSIYKTKRLEQNRLVAFFKIEAPAIAYLYRRFIYYAFIIFGIFTLIGVLSAANDSDFVRLILGDDYVNSTLENIKKGDAVAVYKSGSNWGSFIGITFNNIRVAFTAYTLGITAGIGTAYVMMQNAIMLGSFQYFFYDHGVLAESMRGIWIHGAIEIFVIIISGAAGLMLGASIIFPGTYDRLQSLKRGFKASMKLVLSTVPFFIVAGFLEGFVTRYSNVMPTYVSVGIILITLAIVSYYYLIYPVRLARRLSIKHPDENKKTAPTLFINKNLSE